MALNCIIDIIFWCLLFSTRVNCEPMLWYYGVMYTYAVMCGYCTRTRTRQWSTRTRTCTRSYCTRNIPGYANEGCSSCATAVQVLQDLFYVLLHVLFYLWSLLKLGRTITDTIQLDQYPETVCRYMPSGFFDFFHDRFGFLGTRIPTALLACLINVPFVDHIQLFPHVYILRLYTARDNRKYKWLQDI